MFCTCAENRRRTQYLDKYLTTWSLLWEQPPFCCQPQMGLKQIWKILVIHIYSIYFRSRFYTHSIASLFVTSSMRSAARVTLRVAFLGSTFFSPLSFSRLSRIPLTALMAWCISLSNWGEVGLLSSSRNISVFSLSSKSKSLRPLLTTSWSLPDLRGDLGPSPGSQYEVESDRRSSIPDSTRSHSGGKSSSSSQFISDFEFKSLVCLSRNDSLACSDCETFLRECRRRIIRKDLKNKFAIRIFLFISAYLGTDEADKFAMLWRVANLFSIVYYLNCAWWYHGTMVPGQADILGPRPGH